jgi:hypothetical protein
MLVQANLHCNYAIEMLGSDSDVPSQLLKLKKSLTHFFEQKL